jgi:hypothetical protein
MSRVRFSPPGKRVPANMLATRARNGAGTWRMLRKLPDLRRRCEARCVTNGNQKSDARRGALALRSIVRAWLGSADVLAESIRTLGAFAIADVFPSVGRRMFEVRSLIHCNLEELRRIWRRCDGVVSEVLLSGINDGQGAVRVGASPSASG